MGEIPQRVTSAFRTESHLHLYPPFTPSPPKDGQAHPRAHAPKLPRKDNASLVFKFIVGTHTDGTRYPRPFTSHSAAARKGRRGYSGFTASSPGVVRAPSRDRRGFF